MFGGRSAGAWAKALECPFRSMSEPRRLWKRHLKHNPRFVGLILIQLLGLRAVQLAASHRLPATASSTTISMEAK
jgi:hypothetical protein